VTATATAAVPTSPVRKALALLLARRGQPTPHASGLSLTSGGPVARHPVVPGPSTPDAWLAGLRLGS
jgi:hypothetical protein